MDAYAQEIPHSDQISQDDEDKEQKEQDSSITEQSEGIEPVEDTNNGNDYRYPDHALQDIKQIARLLRPPAYYEMLPGVLSENHPGICVRESESCTPAITKTSPECCLWVQSEEIIGEMLSMISQVCFRGATRYDMLRIVSCLHRVGDHVYRVREDVGLAYPPGATGALAVTRRERPTPTPYGQLRRRPPPSKLCKMWNADDFEAEEDQDNVVRRLELAALRMFPHESGYNGDRDGASEGMEIISDYDQQPANDDDRMDECSSWHEGAILGETSSDDSEGKEDDGDSLQNPEQDAPT